MTASPEMKIQKINNSHEAKLQAITLSTPLIISNYLDDSKRLHELRVKQLCKEIRYTIHMADDMRIFLREASPYCELYNRNYIIYDNKGKVLCEFLDERRDFIRYVKGPNGLYDRYRPNIDTIYLHTTNGLRIIEPIIPDDIYNYKYIHKARMMQLCDEIKHITSVCNSMISFLINIQCRQEYYYNHEYNIISNQGKFVCKYYERREFIRYVRKRNYIFDRYINKVIAEILVHS